MGRERRMNEGYEVPDRYSGLYRGRTDLYDNDTEEEEGSELPGTSAYPVDERGDKVKKLLQNPRSLVYSVLPTHQRERCYTSLYY